MNGPDAVAVRDPADAPDAAASTIDAANPWLGLASFTEETRAYFHGREEEVAELARRVQRELLWRVFADEPYDTWLVEVARDLYDGRLDEELVYRKRIRRPLREYPSEGAPPHVRAARLVAPDAHRGAEVAYVMTTRGPQPATHRQAPVDYAHYMTNQLGPASDVALQPLGTTFDAITARQGELFA